MALALEEYEAGVHACGVHRDLGFSWDSDGWFTVGTATCQACATLARHRESHPEPDPATVTVMWPDLIPGQRVAFWDGHLSTDD